MVGRARRGREVGDGEFGVDMLFGACDRCSVIYVTAGLADTDAACPGCRQPLHPVRDGHTRAPGAEADLEPEDDEEPTVSAFPGR